MSYFKKNKLITLILIAMLIGIVVGYAINLSLTNNKFEYDKSNLSSISNPEIKKQVTAAIIKYEEKIFKESKKIVASNYSILSDIFLHLIKMIIAPLVLAVLVIGVAKVGDFKSVGRIGLKTLIYFTSATLIALAIGLVIVNIFEPGKVMHLDRPEANVETGVTITKQSPSNFIDHVIPESIMRSMAANDILPIVVFALFFGVAAASIGDKGKPIIKAFESLSDIMFKVTNFVMNFAPIGVFGAIAAVVIQQGLDVLGGYLYLILCFFGGLLFFVFVVLLIICYSFKINYFKLLRDIKEPILLAFSTASSESAMPQTIEALEKHGISNRIVSFVLPLGYSFNLDGSIMYMTFATVFIAQSYGMDIGMADQIKMMLILLITSKGMAGVPRASLVVIAGMLSMFKIPGEGLLLLLAVDQLLDMGRSATNVVGNAVASAVVARLEGEKF
ncbi:MAG: dicarboxylate/amino acid:cation symporter [Bacteroidota bacterium]|nr:dicarboxylate/amino acid:cation symporter [Bacteroidota bacterium]MDP3145522.1 dicarboxylate/amino acid:cation symporter [Bacteroidota bacterium]MDP3556482.1 dicarboxylate/amino acid:cation symporter [Bacteroidota bacterium]